MEVNILPEDLLEIAVSIKSNNDPFSQWASNLIIDELKEFFCQNPEVRQIGDSHISKLFFPALEKDYYLEYDGYWMLQCKDENELNDLLKSWYLQRHELENFEIDKNMTFREILDSVDIDNVLTIIENEVWKEKEPCPINEFRSAYNILLAMPAGIEHDQILISTIEDDEIGSYISVENCGCCQWEDNINKVVSIIDDTQLSLEQQAAYCLWEQTFYGFSPQQCKLHLDFLIEDSEYQKKLGLLYTCHSNDNGDIEFKCVLSPEQEELATRQWEEWRMNRMVELGIKPDKI